MLLSLTGLIVLVVLGAMAAPRAYSEEAAILGPSAYFAFLVVSVVAPISAGGGNELYPPAQLLGYPIRAITTFHASLILMPLNIAWLTNVLALIGLTVYIVPPGRYTALAVATALPYAAAATVVGALVAWFVVGLRQSPPGRRLVHATGTGLAVTAAVIVMTGRTTDLLDEVPTRSLVFGLLFASFGNFSLWLRATAVVVVVGVCSYFVAQHACRWALRRPATTRSIEDGSHRHRTRPTHSALRQLVALDRAAVWRSTPLRRGLIVLAAAPAALAAAMSLRWSEILLLPGLAAAGAGLLFGVNVFCLQGPGLPWLSSQPDAFRWALLSKAIVTAEVCGVAVLTTVAAAAVRASDEPSVREITTLAVWCPLVVAVVVAICLNLSVTTPHRADLTGHRDVPAPPGVMALYSVRLAMVTTTLSLMLVVLAAIASAMLLWMAALLLASLCFLSFATTAAKWRDRVVQATVVTRVAAG